MENNFYYSELFEIYKELLTAKQKEIFEMHLNLDLSLSEIAEEKGITRQNVSDTIKNVKAKLLEYESVLNTKEKTDKIYSVMEKIKDREIFNELKEIIEK